MRDLAHAAQAETPTVVGVGINATDTIIRLPRFPALGSKVEVRSAEVTPGGQVASDMVACRRWGLRARYVGKIGDDAAGKSQMDEMKREGIDTRWVVARGRSSQTAYILVDEPSGERTVLWKRDEGIALLPEDLKREWISEGQVLLVDGHDTAAAAQAARWAREDGIPVVGDFDNIYAGIENLLEYVDFVVSSEDFPARLTGEASLLKSLPQIFAKFKCCLMAARLGRLGVLGWDGERFMLCPGCKIEAHDTTGAGDIFHGAFAYGLAHAWPIKEILEFACAAAALNCKAVGARGGIESLEAIAALRNGGERSEPAFAIEDLAVAAAAAARAGLVRPRNRATSGGGQ